MKNSVKQRVIASLAVGAALTLASFCAAAADYHEQDFCADKELDHNYLNPENRERYISCDLSGRAQDMPCVKGLHFMTDETRWGHCDYPDIADKAMSAPAVAPAKK